MMPILVILVMELLQHAVPRGHFTSTEDHKKHGKLSEAAETQQPYPWQSLYTQNMPVAFMFSFQSSFLMSLLTQH